MGGGHWLFQFPLRQAVLDDIYLDLMGDERLAKIVWSNAVAFGLAIVSSYPSSVAATPADDFNLSVQAYERRDYSEAFRLTLAAARAGHPKAQANAAWYYGHGVGTVKNTTNAMFWLNKAVQSKDPFGYNLMAVTHLQGLWTEVDLQKAYDFAQKAKNAGYDTNKTFRERSLFAEIKRLAGSDNYECMTFGFRQGTPEFGQCMMQMAQSRQQQEIARQQYQIQLQQLAQQVEADRQRLVEMQNAQAAADQRERVRRREEASDRLLEMSQDFLCPKTGPGLFAEPVAGCGRNKNQPRPTEVIVVPVRDR